MFHPIATNRPKYLEPLLANSGAPDSDGAKQHRSLEIHIRLTPRSLRCLSLLTSRMRKSPRRGLLQAVQRHIGAGLRPTTRAVKEMGGHYLTFRLLFEPSK